MRKAAMLSLKLGFNNQLANSIDKDSFENMLRLNLEHDPQLIKPNFVRKWPKYMRSRANFNRYQKKLTGTDRAKFRRQVRKKNREFVHWWIDRMLESKLPLRQKMVFFLHNHFVSTIKKVDVPQYIYEHYKVLDKLAFGNFKTLVKEIISTNAMVLYLDNITNYSTSINENLAREILELFTIGESNYTEKDIKEAAKSLAGLTFANGEAAYRAHLEDDSIKTFLGKSGNFKLNDIIDIIFEQPAMPYFFIEKLLKWFITDNPTKNDIKKYGDFLKNSDYELKPMLYLIFRDEHKKKYVPSLTKDPLTFCFQCLTTLQIEDQIPTSIIYDFLRNQGMEIYNQPNVKGWIPGTNWLNSTTYIDRVNSIEKLSTSKKVTKNKKTYILKPVVEIPNTITTQEEVMSYLIENYCCLENQETIKILKEIIPHDFNAQLKGAELVINRAFAFITSTPEFHVV